jgi:hypothetical protein
MACCSLHKFQSVRIAQRRPWGWPNTVYLEEDWAVYHGDTPVDDLNWADWQSSENWKELLQKEAHGSSLW